MDKILFVNACVRGEQSRTRELAQCVLEKLTGEVVERNLQTEELKPLDGKLLQKREELLAAGKTSDEMFRYAREFAEADVIVMAAPYWDMAFPALLKLYLEQITVCGMTFHYLPTGVPEGLCRAKKLYYVTTAGGPIVYNFGYDYVKTLAEQFYGIKETQFFRAENLDIVGNDAGAIMEEAKTRIRKG